MKENALGFFDYRRGVKLESPVGIRRRRRGESAPENDVVPDAPTLEAGRGKPRNEPRDNPADRLSPLQTIVISIALVVVVALLVTIGVLGTLVTVFCVAVPVCFLVMLVHMFRHRPGQGPPLRRRADR